jgi:hypothetical protein
MKCPYCSQEIEDGAIICEHCSSAVIEPERLGSVEARQEESEIASSGSKGGEQQPTSDSTTGYVACPGCGSSNIKKVTYSWWGGALGPRLLNHAKCNSCGMTYNGKTGQSNTTAIVIYSLVVFVVAFALCGGCYIVGFSG